MAATIAHEINNPLEAVTNLVYLLRVKITDDEGRGYLAAVEDELGRVAHIAKQTLGYYREHAAVSLASLCDIAEHCAHHLRTALHCCRDCCQEINRSFDKDRPSPGRDDASDL